MTPFLILAMLGVGLGAMAITGTTDDTDTSELGEEPVLEPEVMEPESVDLADEEQETEEPDVGVSFVVDGDTITIDVGEDETGTVVAVRTELLQREGFRPTATDPDIIPGFQETTDFGVQFFLVPEGLDFPPTVDDVLAATGEEPEIDRNQTLPSMEYQNYLDNTGAEPIGSVDLGTYVLFNPNTGPDDPDVITDLRTAGFSIQSNQEIESFDLITSNISTFSPDGENEVFGIPFIETSVQVVADQSILPTDAEITFENGIIDVILDADVEGQLIAIEEGETFGEETRREVRFFVLPEGSEFPLSVAEVNETLAGRGFDNLGYGSNPDSVALRTMLLVAGAQEIGSVFVGGFGSFFDSRGDTVTYNSLIAYEISDTVDYAGFTLDPDIFHNGAVQDTGRNAIIPVETLSSVGAST